MAGAEQNDGVAGAGENQAASDQIPKQPKAEATVSAESGKTLSTIRNLWPYMWPSDRPDLKQRVVIAFVLLFIAKVITVLVPFLYKWATDALTNEGTGFDAVPAWLVTPVMLVLAYGTGRVTIVGFTQIRDALFASVGQHAVRQLSNIVFRHIHSLSLRYHLERRTGGLSRIIETRIKGIESIVRFTILSGAPTVLEFLMMAVVIWYQFGLWYVLVIGIMIWALCLVYSTCQQLAN